MIDKSVQYLKRDKVDGFKSLRVIKCERQAPHFKKILTKAEFSQDQAGFYKYPDKRCECCASVLLGNSYKFKKIDKTFNFKTYFSCDSFNLLYNSICPTCGEEYASETGIGKIKLRDPVRVYRKHITQPEYQKLKVEKHLKTCGKGTFKVFPLLQMRSSEIDLRRSYERNFMKEYKTKLNNL